MKNNKLMNSKRSQPTDNAISALTMGRALLLLHLASSSASAFTSSAQQSLAAIATDSSSTLQYRTGKNHDATSPVSDQFFNPITSSTNNAERRQDEVNKWRDDSRRSMILGQQMMMMSPPSSGISSTPDAAGIRTTTTTPTSKPTAEREEMDEYIEYLDRRYNRIYSKRRPSQHKHTLKLLGLTSLASDRLRQRLRVVPSSSTTTVVASATNGILAVKRPTRPRSPTKMILLSSPAASLRVKLITDKFITSLRPWLLVERSSGFSIASLAMVMLVQPLLRGIIFRHG